MSTQLLRAPRLWRILWLKNTTIMMTTVRSLDTVLSSRLVLVFICPPVGFHGWSPIRVLTGLDVVWRPCFYQHHIQNTNHLLAGFSSHSLLSVSLSKPAVLNLWSPIKGYFIFCKDINTHTDIPILAIFHGTIFSDGPRPRDKICKWSASLKRLRTAGPDPPENWAALRIYLLY